MKEEKYPYWEINNTVHWFESIFKTEMNKEKWDILKFWDRERYVFVIIHILLIGEYYKNNSYVRNEKLNSIAREYGWIVSVNGLLIGFDINKLERNKHLITGNELGLL